MSGEGGVKDFGKFLACLLVCDISSRCVHKEDMQRTETFGSHE